MLYLQIHIKRGMIRVKKQGWHYGIKNKEIGEKIIKETFLKSNRRWFLILMFVEMAIGFFSLVFFVLGEEGNRIGVIVFCMAVFATMICGFGYKLMKKRIQQCETGEFYVITCVCEKIIKCTSGRAGTYIYYTLLVKVGGEYKTIKCQKRWIYSQIREGEEVTLAMYSLNFKHQNAFVLEKIYREYR